MIVELMFGYGTDEKLLKIVALTDSNQLYMSVHSSRPVASYRLRRDIANIKEQLEHGLVSEVRWVSNRELLADPLTKKGADCTKLDLVLESGQLGQV